MYIVYKQSNKKEKSVVTILENKNLAENLCIFSNYQEAHHKTGISYSFEELVVEDNLVAEFLEKHKDIFDSIMKIEKEFEKNTLTNETKS